jgi:hypothetical protein
MRVTINPPRKNSGSLPPPEPIVDSAQKRGRESFAAIIRPDFEHVEFVNMPQVVSLKEISLRLGKHATAKYVPHTPDATDYQFYAYVDEFAGEKKVNKLGTQVAVLLGFNAGTVHGPIMFVGPPCEGNGDNGQPFDEKTRLLIEKKTKQK